VNLDDVFCSPGVWRRVRTASGSDRIRKSREIHLGSASCNLEVSFSIRRDFLIRSLPLAVLTHPVNAWAREKSMKLGRQPEIFLTRFSRFLYESGLTNSLSVSINISLLTELARLTRNRVQPACIVRWLRCRVCKFSARRVAVRRCES
jgi:hypothetical protein